MRGAGSDRRLIFLTVWADEKQIAELWGRKDMRGRRILPAVALIAVCAILTCCGKKETQHITEEEVVIEGLSKEYRFLFLTDTHVIVQGDQDSDQARENAKARLKGFRNSAGEPASGQFEEWMEYANEENVDGVLLGGDIIDYPSVTNVGFLKEQLAALKMPYLYTLGNHDWTYPWEYMTETGKNTYLPMLEGLLNGNPAVHTVDYGELIVMAVDNSGNQINDAALEECEKVLAKGKPTVVILHVPLLTQSLLPKAKEKWGEKNGVVIGGGNYGGIYPNDASARFLKMITAADSPVELVLAGHVHLYDRDYIDGEKKVLQIVGDSGFQDNAVMLRISGQTGKSE